MFRSLKWFGFWEFRNSENSDSFSFLKHEFDGSLSGGFCRFSQILPIFWVLIFLFLYFNVSFVKIKILSSFHPSNAWDFVFSSFRRPSLWTRKNLVTYSLNFRMWILMVLLVSPDAAFCSSTLWTRDFSGTA
ncbi:uncharacterized protein OCT59_012441 [Rhizophagus irregularis]|uniref:uncharacterized protein n=1 Tax=Rhizophagus irregularis TaxID=588596 RepID=UPI0033275DC4|nr:hypothetical protein OCT59_012441 [Rhizophagus irregularis]